MHKTFSKPPMKLILVQNVSIDASNVWFKYLGSTIYTFCATGTESFTIKYYEDRHFHLPLRTNGLIYMDRPISLDSVMFICDAPARSFLQCINTRSTGE
jgi:hypothetical protein